jgi:sigma-E factor negative regulatory protein RseB
MRGALALGAFLWSGLLAAADAPPLLQRMLDAASTLNYRGHVVQIEGTQPQTLKLLHRAGADAGEDRVHSTQGAYWELRRVGARCKVAMTDARQAPDEALVAAAFPSLMPQRLARLADLYTFQPLGAGRLAERAADFTLAEPRDAFRFAYLLVTDSATGLLLKAGLVDRRGHILRQVFFVDLQLLPTVSEADWQQPVPDAPAHLSWTERNLTRDPASVAVPWPLGPLPAGFQVSGYGRKRMPGSEHEIDQITLSDGLVTVSAFIDAQAGADRTPIGAKRVAAMPVYGASVDGRQVTVLGAAPYAALREIANALTAPTRATSTAQPPGSLPPAKKP